MEEWMFLPANWIMPVKRKQIYFSKNFVLIGFHPLYGHDFLQGTGDILVLNLVSRKNFWMQTEIIKDKVRAKMPSASSRIDDIRSRYLRTTRSGDLRVQLGSRFSKFCWSGPVRDFQIFLDPGPVRDLLYFICPGLVLGPDRLVLGSGPWTPDQKIRSKMDVGLE